jgi:hypothetical protein
MIAPAADASSGVTVDELFKFLTQHQIDDEKIYKVLCGSLQYARYRQLVNRMKLVVNASKPDNVSTAKWQGRQNRIKGRIFERLIDLVLKAVEPFTTWTNVNTTTSELDILVQIGPSGGVIPSLREWGTHFISECKFSSEYVSIQWVTNLNTVLQSHNAGVGVLFSTRGTTNAGNGKKALRQIEVLSVMTPARFIVCVDLWDLEVCANGFNFLKLLSHRYLEAKANAGRLKLLQN